MVEQWQVMADSTPAHFGDKRAFNDKDPFELSLKTGDKDRGSANPNWSVAQKFYAVHHQMSDAFPEIHGQKTITNAMPRYPIVYQLE